MNMNKIVFKYPKSVFLNVTNECNLDCIYCSSKQINCGESLSHNEVVTILKQLKQIGVIRVVLTGGEPLLHNEILFIIKELIKFSHIILNTNGILLDYYIDFLKTEIPLGICDINVSLDSLYFDNNMKTRGKYNIDKILGNIIELNEYGYKCSIMCTVTSFLNINDIEKFCRYAEEYPMVNIVFNQLKPCGKAQNLWQQLKPSADIIKNIIKFSLDYKNVFTSLECFNYCKSNKDTISKIQKSLVSCGAGKECFSIASDGTVYPCTSLNIRLGNVYMDTIKEIFDNSAKVSEFKKIRNKSLDLIPQCAECINFEKCSGGCRANAYSFNENIFTLDPYCSEYSNCNLMEGE